MQNFERHILRDLYESVSGLFAFTLYSRYKINPSQIFNFIEKNSKAGLIIYENDRLVLTDKGREYTLKRTFEKSLHLSKFSKIPKEIIGNRIEINEPYLPSKTKLPKELMIIKKVE